MEIQDQQQAVQPGYKSRFQKFIAPVRDRWQVFDERHRRAINLAITIGLISLLALTIYFLKGLVQFI